MELSRPEYWSGLPFPSPRNLPDPGIEPRSPALQADSLPAETPRKSQEARAGEKASSLSQQRVLLGDKSTILPSAWIISTAS